MWWAWLVVAGWTGDDPGLWWETTGAVAVQPLGALAGATVEGRVPVLRYGGAAFNDTFVGAGGRLTATPAFAEGALRLSAQPIDLLPLAVEVVHSQYWRSPFGFVAMPESDLSGGTDDPARAPLYAAGNDFGGHAWTVIASPTFQIRVGPVVAFSSWNIAWMRIVPNVPQSDPWVFEPYRGMVVGFEDRLVDHTSAVLWEPKNGEDQALLRLGAALRGKWSHVTPDRSLGVGPVVQWRPGAQRTAPTFLGLVAPYLLDPDFVGPIPFVAVLVKWEGGSWVR